MSAFLSQVARLSHTDQSFLLPPSPSQSTFICSVTIHNPSSLPNSGKQRVSKREPLVNPLVIEKVGKYGRRSIWHLDDTPRLYASSNPFKKEATWNAINSTAEGYARLIEDLPEPDREQWATIQAGKAAAVAQAQAQQQAAAAGGKKAQQAAAAAAAASSPVAAAKPKARGRGKGKNVEEMSQEQLLRAHLEEDWPAVLANEKVSSEIGDERGHSMGLE